MSTALTFVRHGQGEQRLAGAQRPFPLRARAYRGKPAIIDGSWQPLEIVKN
ncbi:hypothetical protein [Bosea sp. BIWAKO-01]|uniref:hypothetical protein n=1 Tax=Bosea sp. BIWAKO-01 TaxID=506668 RepID=UPI00086DCD2E|nr:hypothetical protein [Bosea sp. BIWAKO-01]GAU86115.1 hypothetical protein BIWAKO_06063 [Bosea sp. BIWAKO-01]